MALFDDIFKLNSLTGVAVGIGALMMVPNVLPAVGRVVRPALKAAIKGGIVFYRETVAEVGELAGDLIAEARSELESGGSPNGAGKRSVAAARGAGAGR